MKTTRTHGLNEKEMELVKILMADCETTGDIQARLKATPHNSLSIIHLS